MDFAKKCCVDGSPDHPDAAVPAIPELDYEGNPFVFLALFEKAAKKVGWSKTQIEEVYKDALSGSYEHLTSVMEKYTWAKTPEN